MRIAIALLFAAVLFGCTNVPVKSADPADTQNAFYLLQRDERPKLDQMKCDTDMTSGWSETVNDGVAVRGKPAHSMQWVRIVTCRTSRDNWDSWAYVYRLFETKQDALYQWMGSMSFPECVAFADGPIFCTAGMFSNEQLGHRTTLILGDDDGHYRLRIELLKATPGAEKGKYSTETLAEREFMITESQLR